ncbi:hypothetical protein FQZ97_1046550 [compost metagenome]
MRLDRGRSDAFVASSLAGRGRLLGVAGSGHAAARRVRMERLVCAVASWAGPGADRLRLAGAGAGPFAGAGFPAVGVDPGVDGRYLCVFCRQGLWSPQAGAHRESWQKLGRGVRWHGGRVAAGPWLALDRCPRGLRAAQPVLAPLGLGPCAGGVGRCFSRRHERGG